MCCLIAVGAVVAVLGLVVYLLNNHYRKDFIEDFCTKNVFITGTDSGFGRRLALELDGKGLKVYAGCYSEKGAQELKEIASNRMKILRVDVTKRESILKAKEFIESDLSATSGLWAVVNNAGISKGEIFEFGLIQDYRDVLNVNFFGVVEVNEVFLPMVKKSRGRIINVASIMGRCNLFPGPYSASKHALEAYNDGLRRTLKPFGIKVCVIEPGYVRTNMTLAANVVASLEEQWKKLPNEMKEEYGDQYITEAKNGVKLALDNPIIPALNKIEMVTSRMIHAIGSKHPKVRYTVGLDANLLFRPLSILPDVFQDTLYDVIHRGWYNVKR